MIQREHILQKHIKLFVRDAVAARHEFFAFDRTQNTGQFSHMRQKARGVRKGTPDTLLRVQGIVPIWCELKAPGNKPDADQCAMGAALTALGDLWFWCDNVLDYYDHLYGHGVPMRQNAALIAAQHDGAVRSLIAKAEMAKGKVVDRYKRQREGLAEKPTRKRLDQVSALRGRVMF